ncbi:Cad-domain-containing protein [Hypoxylon sp. NC0597]|nr:Cad-domain-containing protein [Hypoxylon sp. NC0597]
MQFGTAVGTACSSFAITNIDDLFVLVTFFAEAATNKHTTPLKITLGQYVGFTVIIVISMIGFGVALVLPSEPIGFLGLLPMLLGVWNLIDFVLPDKAEVPEEAEAEIEAEEESKFVGAKSVFKVAIITVMNGGDNIGTYIPLFSQAQGTEIAVYVIIYYILLGVWCLVGFLVMKQKHILRVAEKYASIVVPFLYIGLGIYIVYKSDCYPWSIEHIDSSISSHPGMTIMAVATTFSILVCMGVMLWLKWRSTRVSQERSARDTVST